MSSRFKEIPWSTQNRRRRFARTRAAFSVMVPLPSLPLKYPRGGGGVNEFLRGWGGRERPAYVPA